MAHEPLRCCNGHMPAHPPTPQHTHPAQVLEASNNTVWQRTFCLPAAAASLSSASDLSVSNEVVG
jgi:hypothetical protein